jgi:hypothetical protein
MRPIEPEGVTDAQANPDPPGKTSEPDSPAEPTIEHAGRQLSYKDAHMTVAYLKGSEQDVPQHLQDFVDAKGQTPSEAEPQTDGTGFEAQTLADNHPVDPVKPDVEEPKSELDVVETTEHGPTAEELTRARQALKRNQMPDELIDALDTDELVKRGKKAAKSQAWADGLASRNAELEATVKRLLDEAGVKTEPNPEPVEPEPEFVDPVQGLVSTLKEDEVYNDLADPLGNVFSEQDRVNRELRAQIANLQAQKEAAELDQVRLSLKSDWPELADDSKYEDVKKKVYELAQLDGYHDDDGNPNIRMLMSDACLIKLRDERNQQQQRKMTERYEQQTLGQPEDVVDDPVSANVNTPMTRDQKSLLAQKLLMTPDRHGNLPSGEDVRKMLLRIPDA